MSMKQSAVQQKSVLVALVSLLLGYSVFAQKPPDLKINAKDRQEVIEGVLKALNESYVVPETAKQIDETIRRRLKDGEYGNIDSAQNFMGTLNKQLREISHDNHLFLGYSYQPQSVEPEHPETPQEHEEDFRAARAKNFGFEKVERLPGNIGYLEMNSFVRPEFSGEMAAAAMTLLANTDALIIDLRNSDGGAPQMVILMASYFFGSEPVHLGDMYFRPENRTKQYWTLPYLPGSRYVGKDVYMLTSKRTFSAAEALPKRLQALNRAMVVGEPTRGGTNPGKYITVHPHFAIFVPIAKPINYGSKAANPNEGIKPDIEVPADQALKRAHLEALNKKVARSPDQKEQLDPIINALKKELDGLSQKQ